MPPRLPLHLLPAILLLAVPAVPADDPPELASLFPLQAEVDAPSDALVRLELAPEVLAACRSDLSDLRLFDAAGEEVPYLVDAGPPPATAREVTTEWRPELLAVDRGVETREGAPDLRWERFRLAAPSKPPPGEGWELVVDTGRPELVRRVTVTAEDQEGAPRTLVKAGSLFRLPDPPRERLRIPLPPFAAETVTIRLEGEDDHYLDPSLRFVRRRVLPLRPPAAVLLHPASRSEREGRTVLELERPRGIVPDALRLATTTASFSRPVTVWDQGPGSVDHPLGRARLFRLGPPAPVEDLQVALSEPGGDRLRVEIDDGDSPPLQALEVTALVRRPVLVFSLPDAAGAPAGTLRFGGGRAHLPDYDLAALVPFLPARGPAAARGERLYDPARLPSARLGALRPNPAFVDEPLLAFAFHPGAALDPRLYSHRRRVTVSPSPEGLVRIDLTLADHAAGRADLADLRIVDQADRQWAYLLEREADLVSHPVPVRGPTTVRPWSRYLLPLPQGPATITQLVVDPTSPFFDRPFRLTARLEDEREVLLEGRMRREPRDPRPVTLAFPPARVDRLELAVDDGNDAALDLGRVEGRFSVARLYFPAPPGQYSLLLGYPEAVAPRYELERVRELVLSTAAATVERGELVPNPELSRAARVVRGGGWGRALLWLALTLAVLALAGMTLRLARSEEG